MTSDCGFKELRGICRWVILPTPIKYIVLSIYTSLNETFMLFIVAVTYK